MTSLFRNCYTFVTVCDFNQQCKQLWRNMASAQYVMQSVSDKKVNVNGVDLQCYMRGNGKHPVVMLPGALGSGAIDLEPQIQKMNADHFTLVAWDPRGYGKSRPPKRDFPIDFFHRDAKDCRDLMKKLGFEQFSVLGWSDGGITAIIMAALFPDDVSKLVLWGANSYVTEKDVSMFEATRDVKKWSERMRAPMVQMYGEEYFQELWHAWIAGMLQFKEKRNGNICKDEASKVKCPTLIVHGAKDPIVPQEHPDFLHTAIQGSKLVTYPDGKHNLHLKYADEFNKLVEYFLLDK